jgi:hypothetical protein
MSPVTAPAALLTVGDAGDAYSMTPDLGASPPPQLTLGNSDECSMTPGLQNMTPQLTLGSYANAYSFSPNSASNDSDDLDDLDDSDSDSDSDSDNSHDSCRGDGCSPIGIS